MTAGLIITVLVVYFLILIGISYFTSRKADNDSFFTGNRKSPWYIVSFGMIGASLSGVTFISIPGWVGNDANQFSYMQAVFGYLVGYFIVAYVLLPLFYRMNVTSIYEYLKDRFGFWSYKTGAFFFMISRIIGASVRLLLVANVLQSILFDEWGIPFEVTVVISILLIWIYTSRGGIKTIVWTDTLQTAVMLASVFVTVWFISDALELPSGKGLISAVSESKYSQIFFFDDFMSKNYFLKHFFGGMFITIGMTGLDQDMMQKNLSCKNIKEAKKNMISMAFVLVAVNLVFLVLGALLYMYAEAKLPEVSSAIAVKDLGADLLFSSVVLSDGIGPVIGVLFLLGLIAAAYSSADSALTSLTTSFSIDFLRLKEKRKAEQERTRRIVHVAMSIVLILVVILLDRTTDRTAIDLLMTFAGFTYGPLIGMFFFGIIVKRHVNDIRVPLICIISMIGTFFLWYFSYGGPGIEEGQSGVFGMYAIGYELILMNSIITFIGLMVVSNKQVPQIELDQVKK